MINPQELTELIQLDLPDARVDVLDKTGMSDHFIIRVVSAQFETVPLMERHRMVMKSLQAVMQDGRLHAAEIQTAVS
jgi:stress-induced morphogen